MSDGTCDTFDLKVRIVGDENIGTFEVYVEMPEIGIKAETLDVDLRRGLNKAADIVVRQLANMGYTVTRQDVLDSISEAVTRGLIQ